MATRQHDPERHSDERGRSTHTEREVIVTNSDGGHRGGAGGVLAAVVAVIGLLLVGWLAIGLLGSSDTDDGTVNAPQIDAPDVTVPSELDINVDDGNGAPDDSST